MNKKCLLIKTNDNRILFTQEKNLLSLIEYAKAFHAEIHLVEIPKQTSLLNLEALTTALCDQDVTMKSQYTEISQILPRSKKNREAILADSGKIRSFIKEKLLAGETVSVQSLKEKFKDFGLSNSSLSNHLSSVRKLLSQDGHEFRKLGAGKYCLSQ